MGPGELEYGLVLLRVVGVSCGVHRRWDGSEEVGRELEKQRQFTPAVTRASKCTETHHADDLRVDALRNNSALGRDPLEHLGQRCGLDLLATNVGRGVVEVKDDGTLVELAEEEVVSLRYGDLCERETRD